MDELKKQAEQFVKKEESEVRAMAQKALMASAAYSLLVARFYPKYVVPSIFLSPLVYISAHNIVDGMEPYMLGAAVLLTFF